MLPLYAAEPLEQRLLLAVLYVDLNAPGLLHDGASWDSAYVDLQQALGKAQAGDQIRIAAGAYKPTTDVDRTKSFQLKSGVALYGGYGGHNAPNSDQRDVQLFPTILSGEIGDPAKTSDNSYHVVYAKGVNATAILDGVTITGGNADGNDTNSAGGGVYSYSSSLTLKDCTFTNNSGSSGGAMYHSNYSSYSFLGSPKLTNCTFTGNSAEYGGGIYNYHSSPTLIQCTFSRNSARSSGGGLSNHDESSPVLIDCVFSGNSAASGGGMCSDNQSSYGPASPKLTNCVITGNAARYGGGIYIGRYSSPTLTNCTLCGNSASEDGGGIYFTSSPPAITNCILWRNAGQQIAHAGAGGSNTNYSLVQGDSFGERNLDADPQFVRNPDPGPDRAWGTLDDDYGDLRLRTNSPAINAGTSYVVSSDLTSDLAGKPRLVGTRVDLGAYETPLAPTVSFADAAQQISENTGIITIALNLSQPLSTVVVIPLLLRGTATLDINYRLLGPESVVFEPGSTTASFRVEILDDNRYDPGATLMLCLGDSTNAWFGAVSTHTITITDNEEPPTLYVDDTATGANNGTSWADAYTSLQAALQAVQEGAVICVGTGSYTPGSLRTDSFQLRNRVAIYGGFPEGGGSWQQRDSAANPTILSGEIGNSDTADDNSYHVVTSNGVDDTAILDGLIITAGNANGVSGANSRGGGMYSTNFSTPSLRDCTFSANSATYGGGACNFSSSPSFAQCAFTGNSSSSTSDDGGGGMCNSWFSSPVLTNCAFTGNSAKSTGGGMYNKYSCPTLINSTLSGNKAQTGGGMFNSSASPNLAGCIFSGNSASVTGGGMYNNAKSSPSLANCTLSQNSADSTGGGMFNMASSPMLKNCTFAGNSGGAMANSSSSSILVDCVFSANVASCGAMYNLSSSPTLTNCTFRGNPGGGLFNYEGSSPILTSCTFSENSGVYGGGMTNNVDSCPKLTQCIFTGNSARYGGGMYNSYGSSPILTDCILRENLADEDGGGMYGDTHSDPVLTRCTFSGNSAGRDGGGIYNAYGASPILTDCTFGGNSANRKGGGMANYEHACPTLADCTFSGNSAIEEGGGLHNYIASPKLTTCTFERNQSAYGGGMENILSSPILTSCVFNGNLASRGGGGVSNALCSPTLVSCIFSGNSAEEGNGGGMHNSFSSPTVTNCTFSGNSNGGMYNDKASPKLANCILWGNSGQQIGNLDSDATSVIYSLVQGGWQGIGNLDADPQFLRSPSSGPDGQWATADDDYGDLRLQSTSPALNAGNNAAVPSGLTTDLAGKPRLVGGTVDLGAYEYQNDELILAGVTTDSFQLRINGPTLEIFRNIAPDQAPPTQSVPLKNLTRLRLQGGQYTLASDLTGLELYLENDSQVRLASSQRLASLSLSPNATLDLADNDLIVSATRETKQMVLAAISTAIKSARGRDGKWLGSGLGSSLAKANKQTGLAILLNEKDGKPILTSFDGQSVGENDILVKYTWNGDVNLDGAVDAADYFLVDSGFITQRGGYRNGDLNFDGKVDAADYFLIDSAFIAQSGTLAAEEVPAATEESIMLKAAITPRPQPTPSVLAQLFSVEPVL